MAAISKSSATVSPQLRRKANLAKREVSVTQLSAVALLLLLFVLSLLGRRDLHDPALPILRVFESEAFVRVRLTRLKDRLEISSTAKLSILSLDDESQSAEKTREGRKAYTVSFDKETLRVGTHVSSRGFEIRAAGDAMLEINGIHYPGYVRLLPDAARGGVVILHVPLETYVAYVLPREMPLAYPTAALEAQAVAVRGYAVATMLDRRKARWDLVDTEASQVFGGHSKLIRRARKHVDKTKGQIMAFNNEVLATYFSSTCGGHTRDNASAFGARPIEALRGVRCGFCDWSRDSRWRRKIDRNALRRKLGFRQITSVSLVESSRGKRFPNILIEGTSDRERANWSAKDFRRHLGRGQIRSSWITDVALASTKVEIQGRGFGHGVGLCQNGARGMAEAGLDGSEILTRYYPGASLARLAPKDH
ncbi:MAG: SpoIID/LytB domain-containing protein [Planctomycetota bacterium]